MAKPIRTVRKKDELSLTKNIVKTVLDNNEIVKEIEEVNRLRGYEQGNSIKYGSQKEVNYIINRT